MLRLGAATAMLCMAGSVHRSPAAVYVGAACG